MESLWWSIAPSVVAIVLAAVTRQVIPSLLLGLWLGSFLVAPGFLASLNGTVDYVAGTIADRGSLDVMLFLYVFSGLVGMIQISGGVHGFAQWVKRIVKSKRGALLATWALEPITFIDCGFRVVATGAVMKPVTRNLGVSPERLAFTLNNSASPVISLIPVATTYVGYMLGVIAQGMRSAGVAGSPFPIFLGSIPFNFFSYTIILVSLASIFFVREMGQLDPVRTTPNASPVPVRRLAPTMEVSHELGPEPDHERAAKAARDTARDQTGTAMKHMAEPPPVLPPRSLNLILPVALLIALSFALTIGRASGPGGLTPGSLVEAEAARKMFIALLLTTLFAVVLYLIQGAPLQALVNSSIHGGNKLMVTIVILALAWPIADVSRDLGLPRLIETTLGNQLPAAWVPVTVFSVTALVTYFIGSSWGAWALMMPLALPVAVASGLPLPLAAAAVFSGGTFGDVTSPLSGMTAMSAGIAEADHARYVRAATPYNLAAALLAAGLFALVPQLVL